MMRHLIPHHIGLLQDLGGEGIYPVGGCLVDDDGERRLDGVGEIADMGTRALDDLAVGVDQRVVSRASGAISTGNSPSSRSARPERMSRSIPKCA